MKIDTITGSTSSVSGDTKARPSRAATSSLSSGAGTKVEISSFSEHLQQAEKLISQTPVVNSERVSEIKQAISEGQFQVDPEKIADGLINSVRQMLARTRPE